jgi:hypothetical protein
MMMRLATGSFDEESSTGAEDTPMAKEPLSPPSGAESLFLAGLTTSKLSAAAVSDQIKIIHSSRKKVQSFDSRSIMSGRTDDFWSCAENPSDLDDLDKSSDDPLSQHPVSRSFLQISEEVEQPSQPTAEPNSVETFFNDIMSTFYSSSKYNSTPTAASSPTKMPPKPSTSSSASASSSSSSSGPDLSKIDAAEIAYAKAKDVWAWGKTVPVVSFFVGTTETVATKALGVAGTDFSSLDGKIAEELAKLDSGILNPAIEAVAKAVISAAAHSEEHLKPIILSILSTVGMIKSEANEATPEAHTSTPELTSK